MSVLAQYLLAVGVGLSVALLGFIANMLRRAIRDHSSDHRRLAEVTKQNSEAIVLLLAERKPRRRKRRKL